MKKILRGVVFASSADDDYDGMAHVWVRDADTAYWLSLARPVGSDAIEVVVEDQIRQAISDLCVTLSPSKIQVRLSDSVASTLDGHLEYDVELHPDSQDLDSIAAALEAIFRGKSGLQLNI